MTARRPLVLKGPLKQQLQDGDTLLLPACTTAAASLNSPHGTAPSSPVDGDIWTTTAGLFVRINGATVGPLGIYPISLGFILNTGSPGTDVGPELAAIRAGSLSKCIVVVKASDGATDLTFDINLNGTTIFTSPPTIPAGTATGTVVDASADLDGVPISVAYKDVFTIDVTSGTADWSFTIELG